MAEDRGLQEYGLRPAQEIFLEKYLELGDVEEAAQWAERKPATCRQWMREPKFQQALNRELNQKLSGGAMAALDRMLKLSRGELTRDPKVQLQAARDLLDRAGYKPEHLHTSADKRMEQASVEDMMGRIKELQRELGIGEKSEVIDVEHSEVGSGNNQRTTLPEPPGPGDADPLEPGAPAEKPAQDQDEAANAQADFVSGSGGGEDIDQILDDGAKKAQDPADEVDIESFNLEDVY